MPIRRRRHAWFVPWPACFGVDDLYRGRSWARRCLRRGRQARIRAAAAGAAVKHLTREVVDRLGPAALAAARAPASQPDLPPEAMPS
jgi:hypothetical protein